MIEYADGIADVAVIGPTVRIEFFVLRPDPRRDHRTGEQPELVRMPTMTLALPIESFMSAVSALEKMRSNLSATIAPNPRDVDGRVEGTEPSPNFRIRSQQ